MSLRKDLTPVSPTAAEEKEVVVSPLRRVVSTGYKSKDGKVKSPQHFTLNELLKSELSQNNSPNSPHRVFSFFAQQVVLVKHQNSQRNLLAQAQAVQDENKKDAPSVKKNGK